MPVPPSVAATLDAIVGVQPQSLLGALEDFGSDEVPLRGSAFHGEGEVEPEAPESSP